MRDRIARASVKTEASREITGLGGGGRDEIGADSSKTVEEFRMTVGKNLFERAFDGGLFHQGGDAGEKRRSITFQTMEQSWFTPFSPLLEKADTKLPEPSTSIDPDDRRIVPFFLAALAIESAASLPPSAAAFFLPAYRDFTSPLRKPGNCPINGPNSKTHEEEELKPLFSPSPPLPLLQSADEREEDSWNSGRRRSGADKKRIPPEQ